MELGINNKIVESRSYSGRVRAQLCGNNGNDVIDQIHEWISHTNQTLVISVTVPANAKLAIQSISLDVGTCPRNCLRC
jgi:hypothetical protein